MSSLLRFEHDPVDQPAATDPLERATWASLRIRIGHRTVSRVLDRALGDERALLYVPLFGIAEWLVSNWWALLNEPCRHERLPDPVGAATPEFLWTRRHCLRAADSSLLLPALYLYSDSDVLACEWQPDVTGGLEHQPAAFVDSGRETLDPVAAEQALAEFVSDVLSRTGSIAERRAGDVRRTWDAIREADASERDFCRMSGRMGLDPYDAEQMTPELCETLERLTAADAPYVRDLTMAVPPDLLSVSWDWVSRVKQSHRLVPSPALARLPRAEEAARADLHGYLVAEEVRRRASLAPDEVVWSVPEVGSNALGARVEPVQQNHLPGRQIRLVAGRSDDGVSKLVGPPLPRRESERFRDARGLYLLATGGTKGPRLVTSAFTWEQRASRAFAAELLAPRQALKARTGECADKSQVETLAADYQVSTLLVENQLRNAKVSLDLE